MRSRYDWRRCEAVLNGWSPHATILDGLSIAFFHIRSPEPGALPMIMSHGWPGSVNEFNRVVGPLTDPVAHGGEARDAFHLVLPCLPGFGYSEKPSVAAGSLSVLAERREARLETTRIRPFAEGQRSFSFTFATLPEKMP